MFDVGNGKETAVSMLARNYVVLLYKSLMLATNSRGQTFTSLKNS